jgi:hypothetical protein
LQVKQTMKITLGLLILFAPTFISAQIEDSVFLKRYLYNQDVEFYQLPLTSLCLIQKAYHPENNFYNLRKDFEQKSRINLLIIEMNPQSLPRNKLWGEGYYHGLQLTREVPVKEEKDLKIVLGNNGKKLKIKNQFATWDDRTFVEKTDKKGRQFWTEVSGTHSHISGHLKIEKAEEGYLISGEIEIKSIKPLTLQKITFLKNKVGSLTLDQFQNAEKEKFRLKQEALDKDTEVFIKVLMEKRKFYDSIFSNDKYPQNHLIASLESNSKSFDFKLNKGFIIPNSAISTKENDTKDIFSNDLFPTEDGKNYLISLSHFNDPDTAGMHDETTYSVLIDLPSITTGTFDLSNENVIAKLGYFHYGALARLIQSNQYSGQITITESTDNLVKGTLNISFQNTDNSDFNLKGEFQLPIVTRETFRLFKEKLEKLTKEQK